MKILYLAPLVPAESGNGGKRAVFNHLADLVLTTHDVDLIVVDVDASGETIPPPFKVLRGHVFPRGIPRARSLAGLIFGLMQWLFDERPRAAAVVTSRAAREAIKKVLCERRPDLIVVDHLNAASLLDGIHTEVPLQYIAHNVESDVLDDQRARFGRWTPRGLHLGVEVWKTRRYEAAMLRRAAKVTTIAATDSESALFRSVHEKVVLWPELPLPKHTSWTTSTNRSMLFVGAASYFPNRDAIEWMVGELMPMLSELAPDVTLRIAGTSSNDIPGLQELPSVVFEGYVSNVRLEELHQCSTLFLSPVVLGSGIKIKVLEASSYGMPVAATEQSLRGITYLDDAAMRFDRNDQQVAVKILELLSNPNRLQSMSKRALLKLRQARSNRGRLVTIPSPHVPPIDGSPNEY